MRPAGPVGARDHRNDFVWPDRRDSDCLGDANQAGDDWAGYRGAVAEGASAR